MRRYWRGIGVSFIFLAWALVMLGLLALAPGGLGRLGF